jgi:uncharacterized protein (DUF1778 family)
MWQTATVIMSVQLIKEKKTFGRINVRVDADIKDRISKAAHVLGQDLTEFTVSTLNERAREVIEKYERFEMTEVEKNDLFALLDGLVSKPTKRSLKAVKKYDEMIKKGLLRV